MNSGVIVVEFVQSRILQTPKKKRMLQTNLFVEFDKDMLNKHLQ